MICEELREHYELYALGLAEEPERGEIHAHLERRCAACERGFRQALGLVARLSAAAPAAAPPARLRRRLLASVGVPQRHYGWPLFWGATALLCVSAAVYFSGRERQYAEESLRLRRQVGDQATGLRHWQEAFAILSSPGTAEAAFGRGQPTQPAGRVFVNPSRGVLFIASHLPPAPAGRTYEMWIVPKAGEPRPAGQFQSRSDGSAVHIQPNGVDAAATSAIAVTMEDEAGARHPSAPFVIFAALPPPGR